MNECFRSDLCLYHPPNVLAAATLYMSFRFLRIEMSEILIQDKQLNLTESTDVSCYERPENLNGIGDVFKVRKEEVKVENEEESKVEENRPFLALNLKMSLGEAKPVKTSPEKASMVFCLKKNVESEEKVHSGSEKSDDNMTLLGKRSSPCGSEKRVDEVNKIKKDGRGKKDFFFEGKLSRGFELDDEEEKRGEDYLINHATLSMKRIKSTIISKSNSKKTVQTHEFDFDYEELEKISLKRSTSEKGRNLRKIKDNDEKQNLTFWWKAFGEEVELLTILNISEAIYSQLKLSKK